MPGLAGSGGIVILNKVVRKDLIEKVTKHKGNYENTKEKIPLIVPPTENQCGKCGFFFKKIFFSICSSNTHIWSC